MTENAAPDPSPPAMLHLHTSHSHANSQPSQSTRNKLCSSTSNNRNNSADNKKNKMLTAHILPGPPLTSSTTASSTIMKSTIVPPIDPTKRCWNLRVTRTLVLRILFVSSLLFTVILCTTLTYIIISDLELEISRQTYQSVAASALTAAKQNTLRKFQGGDVMESILSSSFPDASMWPNVGLNGYYETANVLGTLTGSTSTAMIVLVEPEEAEAFEAHTEEHYMSQGYPEGAGVGGPGIGFSIRYRGDNGTVVDHSGNVTVYETDNQILTPVLDHSTWGSAMLMYNVHHSSTAVDSVINCSKKYVANFLAETKPEPDHSRMHPMCMVVTGFKITETGDLMGLIYKPIYPANDPLILVGMVGLSVNFKDVLVSVVPDHFDGVTAVISTYTTAKDHTTIDYDSVTYEIVRGVPRLVGEGDHHNKNYDAYGHSIILNDFTTDAKDAVTYTLTLYPSDFNQFKTKSPLALSLAFVAVILASTSIFFLYDYLMRRQSNEQILILDMKRRFVRFISHEIRTPLNTVSMGLELLEDEIRSRLPAVELMDLHKAGRRPSLEEICEKVASKTDETSLKLWHDITRDLQENAASAVNILNDLLNYDKIESGTLQLEVGVVCIIDLVAKAVAKFQVQAANRHVDLKIIHDNETESRLDDALVVGDEIRLTQVVCNLVSNALKFTPTGGVVIVGMDYLAPTEGTLSRLKDRDRFSENSPLCDRPLAGSILISVKDSGVGMTQEQISMLFSEGVQFNANKLQAGGGSGLGLCISKGIVEIHHGIVNATSDGPGKGSNFSVELPLYDFSLGASTVNFDNGASSEDQPSEVHHAFPANPTESSNQSPHISSTEPAEEGLHDTQPTSSPASDFSEKKSHHILVVEDVLSSRKMLARLLERAGHTCEAACDGQGAVEAVMALDSDDLEGGRKPFDTILMDYEMPRLNGPDATEKIRGLGFKALIIGVTGNVLKEDCDFFISKGADCVLPKPVSMSLLNDAWENPNRRKRSINPSKSRAMLTKHSSTSSSFLSNCSQDQTSNL